jgi:PAS domain S-box-containing protein
MIVESFCEAHLVEEADSYCYLCSNNDQQSELISEATYVRELIEHLNHQLSEEIAKRTHFENALRKSNERETLLFHLRNALQLVTDPIAIQKKAAHMLGNHLNVCCSYFASLDWEREMEVIECEYACNDALSQIGERSLTDATAVAQAYRTGEVLVVDDLDTTQSLFPTEILFYKAQLIRSVLCMPLVKNGITVASMTVLKTVPHCWSEEELLITHDVLERTWTAVEHARSEILLKSRAAQQKFLLKLSDTLRTQHDESAVANRALRMLAEELGLSRCHIIAMDLAADRADILYQFVGPGASPMPTPIRMSDFPTPLQLSFEQTVVFHNVDDESTLTELDRQSLAALKFAAFVVACLRHGEKKPVWGVCVVSAKPRRWTANEISIIEEVAERTWAAIERVRSEAALRDSEGKYRKLFDSIDEGFCLIEMIYDNKNKPVDWRFNEVNPTFIRQSGFDPTGKTIREFAPDVESFWLEFYDQVAQTGEPKRAENYVRAMKRWYSVFANRVGGVGSRRLTVVFDDITERKQSEQTLIEADRRKDEFLAVLAHELRNPLFPIKNAIYLFKQNKTNVNHQQLINIMERQINHMVRLIDDLLEVSRITTGKIELRNEPISLTEIMNNAIEVCNPLLTSKKHQLNIFLSNDLYLINADLVRMTQIFANLLTNAAKYTPEQGVITVKAYHENERVFISVADNGIGISADMLPQIFDMFTQDKQTISSSNKGLGIGLAMVRSLVELHAGTVKAYSAGRNKGSEFIVCLPLHTKK